MAQRAGVRFEVERLELEDDRLVVSGHWSGVRGLRFVRPTLVADERRILATLEHKPWAPTVDSTWTAAFPWEGDDVDAGSLTLAVTPQVTVSLGGGAPPAPSEQPLAPPVALRVVEPEPEAAREPGAQAEREPEPASALVAEPADAEALLHERDALRRRLEDYELHVRERERRAADAATLRLDEAVRERTAAARDRDRALAQLREAVEAREAAVRTRARMELAHDEALQEREIAEAKLAKAQAERDEANAQRDEVLLAYRALQRHVRSERAAQERARGHGDGAAPGGGAGGHGDGAVPGGGAGGQGDEARSGAAAMSDAGAAGGDAGGDGPAASDEPLGVRTMPAARTIMSELQPLRRESKLLLSQFDLWIIRVLGTVAAGCFILLLISILRVFV